MNLKILVKELVLNFGMPQCQIWFTDRWLVEYYESIIGAMYYVGHKKKPTITDLRQMMALFKKLDDIYREFKNMHGPDDCLNLSIAEWERRLDR